MDFELETKLVALQPGVWAVDQGMVRSFFLVGEKAALLLDTGAAEIDLPALLKTISPLEPTLVLTHTDGDHTAALGHYSKAWVHPADVPHLKQSFQGKLPELLTPEEGQVFDLGGFRLEVVYNPGHTPGSLSLLDREHRSLYSGDTVSYGPVFMFGEHRDPEAFIRSMDKLQALSGSFDTVYPCHNLCPVGTQVIGELRACMQGILNGSLQGTKPEGMLPPGAAPLLYQVGQSGIYFAPQV